MYSHWRFIYQEGGGVPINRFNPAIFKSLPARQYDFLPLRNICVTNDYEYLQFVIIIIVLKQDEE